MLARLEIGAGRDDHGGRPDLGAARRGLDQHDPAAGLVRGQADHGGAGTPVDPDNGCACFGRRLRPPPDPRAPRPMTRTSVVRAALTARAGASAGRGWAAASQSQEPRRCFSTDETGMACSAATIRATSRLQRLPWQSPNTAPLRRLIASSVRGCGRCGGRQPRSHRG